MTSYLVVDQIENGIAACEIEQSGMKMIPLSLLPQGVQEGDCLIADGFGHYRIDRVETQRRRQYNAEMMRRLMKKTKATDGLTIQTW